MRHLLFVLAASAVNADGLSPEGIAEALREAQNKHPGCYPMEPRAAIGAKMGITVGCVSTQYTNIVSHAQKAASTYETFTADDAAKKMGPAGEVRVHAFALTGGPRVNSVRAVVILPTGSKDPAAAIRPTSTEEEIRTYKNGFGAEFEGKSLTATFPVSALRAGEIHVIYESGDDYKVEVRRLIQKNISTHELEALLGPPDSKAENGKRTLYKYGAATVELKGVRVADVKW